MHLGNHLFDERPVKFFNAFEYLELSSKKRVDWYVRTSKISKTGVLGDPTRASAEKGHEVWRIMINNLVELVEDLKGMTLDDIYQRRY